MEVTLLANILSPIAYLLGLIMNGIYTLFHWFGIQNIALSIFVFTFIAKTLMLPLTIKQQKYSRVSSRVTPEIQKIQAKYKGKKDEESLRKQNAEVQAVYKKYGASPTAGCLPLLITLPIMFALYQVINNIPNYVNLVREQYEVVATAISTDPEVLKKVAEGAGKTVEELTNNNGLIINILAKFNEVKWSDLLNQLSGDAVNAIQNIRKVNGFFGLSITNNPDWKSVAIIIPILAMALQFVQGKLMEVKGRNSKDDPTASAMSSMNIVMPIMSGFFCIMLPIGVGLYWIANSLISIIQQIAINKYLDRMNLDELVEKSSAKATGKYVNRSGGSLRELATKQTKTIETINSEKEKGLKKEGTASNDSSDSSENEKSSSENYKPTSISEIANLLKNRNEKGDK